MNKYSEEEQKLIDDASPLIEKRLNLPAGATMKVNPKWRLPEGYIREYISSPDMEKMDMLIAFTMEYGEELNMNKYKNKKCKLVRIYDDGNLVMSADFGDESKPLPVFELTPTLIMFIATHLEHDGIIQEAFGGGYLEQFCEEYYETQTTEVFKRIISKEKWQNTAKAAHEYVVEHFNSLERE